MKTANNKVTQIEVRGGNVHNLKNIDVNIPLNKFVAISGPSGSGKSSLAMGILYAEGSRRYLEALSTYTRRRISQSKQSDVKEIRHIPSAIALRQRPNVPSERSTVGSMSEIFNVVRLIFSRLGSTICPNGHRIQPSL
ncbi:MAG: ATP-binding cassette domain-containing protein, partial [Lentilactobacillus parabuchneri]